MFSGLRRVSNVPSGRVEKASSVDANTVKGQLPFKIWLRPTACRAVISVVKVPGSTAVSIISLQCQTASVDVGILDAAAAAINARLIILFSLNYEDLNLNQKR